MLLDISTFIGRFHPLLVHLPIGVLLVAALFQFLSRKEKHRSLQSAVGISLLIGMAGAVLSSITGYLLAQSGEYESGLISQHQWAGFATAAVSVLAYFSYKKGFGGLNWLMMLLTVSILITGHLGGSITHGAGYLTEGFVQKEDKHTKPIANIQEAVLYADIIRPILENKCAGCHGGNKQKGQLRLDDQSFIIKGGKNGPVIDLVKADESNLLKRILLPREHDDHMPPIEKPQLTAAEIDLLKFWVNNGADFHKKIKDFPKNNQIERALTQFQSGEKHPTAVSGIPVFIPTERVDKPDVVIVQKIKSLGATVVPVAQNSNYLSVNFINATFTGTDLKLLEPIGKQLIWLKLGNTKIADSSLAVVAKLTNLTKLYVENTDITDSGIAQLKTLPKLQYLNLVGTKTTIEGLTALKGLTSLNKLFLYKTGVSGEGFFKLKGLFPKTLIDTGGYKLEFLTADTVLMKPLWH